MRLRFTIELTRSRKAAPEEPEEALGHPGNDTMVETTLGGDPSKLRMGFVPSPIDDFE